jgi:DNA-binding CsgD family transcriptional regulator
MRDFSRFTSADLTAVMKLFGEIQELPPDRIVRAEHLVRGLAQIVHAQVGIVSEIHNYQSGNQFHISPVFDFGWSSAVERSWNMKFFEGDQLDDPLTNHIIGVSGTVITRARVEMLADSEWYRSPNVMELRRRARIDHCIYSNFFTSPGEGMSLAFHRAWGDRPFTARDVAIVDIVHANQQVYALPDRGISRFSQRHRQVLDALLAGNSEKQIARKLDISQHTVHFYVKALYESLKVCSRPELMSLWVSNRPDRIVPGESKV